MFRKTLLLSLGGFLAFALAAFTPSARADELNQASRLTFNQPVSLPNGVVLPSGTYWFVRPDGIMMPDVVEVLNAKQNHVYDILPTIRTVRKDSTEHTQLTFGEGSSKQPITLMKWYYPDRLTGHEFVYSSREEARLNESGKITVIAKPAQNAG
jgi:hypothetical protein